MKKTETPIPGPPCANKAPENMALGSAPAELIPSQPIEQKLPHAAFEKKPVKQSIQQKEFVLEEYINDFTYHPYETFIIKKQSYPFRYRIKNYDDSHDYPLEE